MRNTRSILAKLCEQVERSPISTDAAAKLLVLSNFMQVDCSRVRSNEDVLQLFSRNCANFNQKDVSSELLKYRENLQNNRDESIAQLQSLGFILDNSPQNTGNTVYSVNHGTNEPMSGIDGRFGLSFN